MNHFCNLHRAAVKVLSARSRQSFARPAPSKQNGKLEPKMDSNSSTDIKEDPKEQQLSLAGAVYF